MVLSSVLTAPLALCQGAVPFDFGIDLGTLFAGEMFPVFEAAVKYYFFPQTLMGLREVVFAIFNLKIPNST